MRRTHRRPPRSAVVALRWSMLALGVLVCDAGVTAQVTERPGLKQYLLDVGAEGIEQGGAYYLPTADLQVTDELRYADSVGAFAPATSTTVTGEVVELEARFNRADNTVESALGDRVIALSGRVFPVVRFADGRRYEFRQPPKGRDEPHYFRLAAGGPATRYRILTGYRLQRAQGTLSDQGIASAVSRAVGFRLDSLHYVVGLGEGLVDVPARPKPLRKLMSPCELAALEAMPGRYGQRLERLRALVAALEEACGGGD